MVKEAAQGNRFQVLSRYTSPPLEPLRLMQQPLAIAIISGLVVQLPPRPGCDADPLRPDPGHPAKLSAPAIVTR